MKYLIPMVVVMLVGIGVAHFVGNDAGFVVIGYGGKVARMSFVFFAIVMALGMVFILFGAYFLYRLVTLRARLAQWSSDHRQRRAQKALNRGVLSLAEGDYVKAEELFRRGVDPQATTAAHYLGAAEAAQALAAPDRRDTYLSLAHEATPDAEVAISIKRTEMQLDAGQLEQARITLQHLLETHPDNKHLLRLLREVHERSGDWRAIMAQLPTLKRHRVYTKEEHEELENLTGIKLLSEAFSSSEDLNLVWRQLSKAARQNTALLAAYVKHLIELQHHEEVEILLRKAIGHAWQPSLVLLYGQVRGQNLTKQLARAEAWLETHTEDPALLLTLSRLSIGVSLWGKARAYLDTLIAISPSPLAFQMLAGVLEQIGESAKAAICQQDGLALATGEAGFGQVNKDAAKLLATLSSSAA